MNPDQEKYTTEPIDINVTEVVEKLRLVLGKERIKNSKAGKNFKKKINLLYENFLNVRGTTKEYNSYNTHRLSIINSSDENWSTWFAYQLLIIPKVKIPNYLDHHYSNTAEKEIYLSRIDREVLNFLIPLKFIFFQEKINQISIWLNNKMHSTNQNSFLSGRKTFSCSIEFEDILKYFHQLTDKNVMDKDDVDDLVLSNFSVEKSVQKKKFVLKNVQKNHFIYFVTYFFKNYSLNQSNHALNSSQFLRDNFHLFHEENQDAQKEKNLRKNFRNSKPNNYLFDLK